MSDKQPEISILTPSYNYGRFIRDCIESVRQQRGVEIEHIVQDGVSSDDTRDLLSSYSDIQWISQPDEGQADALNRAYARARGRWIGWLNADEFYLEDVLCSLVQTGETRNADVVFGDLAHVDAAGRLVRVESSYPTNLALLKLCPGFGSCAAIFRRSALGASPWDPKLRRVMDWDLYLRMKRAGCRFVYRRVVVAAFREHPHQVTAQPSNDFETDYNTLRTRYGVDPLARKIVRHQIRRGWKAATGAYVRELMSRRSRGRSLRWFE